MTNDVTYWGQEDDELLTHDHIDEAVEAVLDDFYPDPLPATLEMTGFRTLKVANSGRFAHRVVDYLLEDLDDEYGDPDDYTLPTDTMLEAAQAFVDKVISEYRVWTCEPVTKETIDVRRWVGDNRPDWLEEGISFELTEEQADEPPTGDGTESH